MIWNAITPIMTSLINIQAHSLSLMKADEPRHKQGILSFFMFILPTFKWGPIELLQVKHMQKSIGRNELSQAFIFVTTGYDISNISTSTYILLETIFQTCHHMCLKFTLNCVEIVHLSVYPIKPV